MGKPRDLFKNIRDAKETFHAKMCTIKDRYGMDLTEEEITSGLFDFSVMITLCSLTYHNADNKSNEAHFQRHFSSLNCSYLSMFPS